MSATDRLSLRLQDIAQSLDDVLRDISGDRVAFVLVLQSDQAAQYVATATARRAGN